MALVVFQHVEQETTAALGRSLQGNGHRLRTIELYAGASVPIDLDDVDGVVSMGGPMNVDQVDQYPWLDNELNYLRQVHEAGKPIVGVCLGAQLIATALGGQVAPMQRPEVGYCPLRLAFPGTIDTLYSGLPWSSSQFHLHGQEITEAPPGATLLSSSELCSLQAFKVGLRTYGFQYHFEWNQEQIAQFARDPLVEQAGVTAQAIIDQIPEQYDRYRHLGDRLCHNIAAYLFPIANG